LLFTDNQIQSWTTTIELWQKNQWKTCQCATRWLNLALRSYKIHFRPQLCPDTAGEAYDTPQTSLLVGGIPLPIPTFTPSMSQCLVPLASIILTRGHSTFKSMLPPLISYTITLKLANKFLLIDADTRR